MQKQLITLIIAIQFALIPKIYSQNVALNNTGNNADTSAMLDISSINKGLLLPRMSTAQVTAIPLPATGLIVFNTTINAFQVNTGTAVSPNWQTLGTTNGSWSMSGNNSTTAGTNYIGTGDAVDFVTKTYGLERMRISSGGNVGIGTASPGSTLDIKGTLRLSGSTSGYVGLSPAAAAGSTTYTLPTADGAPGQQLTTSGAGTLSWATATGSTTNVITSAANILTSTVNGITDTAKTVNSVANSSSVNALITTVNGVAAAGVNIINSNALNSSTNTLTSTVNGVAAAGVNIINTNALSLSGQNLTSTTNGIASSALSLATIDSSIYKTDGALRAARTVTMGANNLTFSSSTGNLIFNPSSTGSVGIGNINPSKTLDVIGTGRFTNTLTVGAYTLPATDGSSNQVLTTNGSGAISWANAGGSTTNVITSAANIITSTVNGITDTAKTINSVANGSSVNTLTTTVNGVAATGVNIINSNALSLSGQNLTSTTNGVASTALSLAAIDSSIYKTDGTLRGARIVTMGANNLTFNSSTGNLIFNPSSTGKVGIGTTSPNYALHIHDATVNPSGGNWMQISNNASGSGTYDGFYYGVSAAGVPQIWAENYLDIITGSGTTNNTTMRLLANGNVGIGNTNPSKVLDVTGTGRFTGAVTVGAYTLPATDGSSNQVLTTNGSGAVSWASAGAGSGWSLTGNGGTSAGTNYIGTSDNNDLVFKRYATNAGALTANNTSFGVSTYVTGSNNVAIGTSAQTQTSNAVAIGQQSYIDHQFGVAIGDSTQVQGASALSIGANAYASGDNSIAIGGSVSNYKTQAQGKYSISLGYNAYSSSQDAIAIGDHAQAQGTNTTVIGTGLYNGSSNTVAIGNSSITSFLMNGASAGGSKALVVGSSSSNGNGAYLTTGGTWTNASDRNLKDGFSNVDGKDILNKISQLDITRWKYKGTNEYHIGPMAQDFYKAFKLGNDDKHISTIDPAGVALACIKALAEQNAILSKRLDEQEAIIKQLQK